MEMKMQTKIVELMKKQQEKQESIKIEIEQKPKPEESETPEKTKDNMMSGFNSILKGMPPS